MHVLYVRTYVYVFVCLFVCLLVCLLVCLFSLRYASDFQNWESQDRHRELFLKLSYGVLMVQGFSLFTILTRLWLRFQYGHAGKHVSESSSAASPKSISKAWQTHQNQSWRRLEMYRNRVKIVSKSYRSRNTIVSKSVQSANQS